MSSKVEQQKLWLLELGENFLWLVDLVLEIDAAVVEALGVVDWRVVECAAESAGGLSPEHLGRGLMGWFYFHQ